MYTLQGFLGISTFFHFLYHCKIISTDNYVKLYKDCVFGQGHLLVWWSVVELHNKSRIVKCAKLANVNIKKLFKPNETVSDSHLTSL